MAVWTKEQERAITERGNLLVSAAAGAGKTAVMTERIAKLIAGGAKAEELLVVTFTRAAAAEMKQRIEARLNSLAESESDEKKRRHIYDAAADIGGANISTIHSFCQSVLRHNAHLAGIDPAFRTADDSEAALLQAEALDEVMEAFYARAEGDEGCDFALLSKCLSDKAIEELIMSIYNFIIARPNPLDWLAAAVCAYDEEFGEAAERAADALLSSAKRRLWAFYHEAESLYRLISEEGEPSLKYLDVIHNDMSDLLNFAGADSYDAMYRKLDGYRMKNLPRKAAGEELPDSIERYRKAYKALIGDLKDDFMNSMEAERRLALRYKPCMSAAYDITKAFMELYAEKKRRAAIIDFNDMEQFTLAVLQNEDAADEYRRRFTHIFVDEYQDTNPVQDAIIAAVSRGDNLFLVGDVKQSIYRFRQAEPVNFMDKYRRYNGKSGTRIDLNANFRSRSAIINATNRLFSQIMRGSAGEIDYSDNAELRAGGDSSGGGAELILISLSDVGVDPDDEAEAYERAEAEALAAAERIHFHMETGNVFDKTIGGFRKPVYSDFAVLMRRTSGAALSWLNTLTACGIPCTVSLNEGYFDAIEVQIFINLLRIIDNRRQDIPLMSVLRSPIVGLTSEEMVKLKTLCPGECLLDRVEAARSFPDESFGRKCAKLLDDVELWREYAARSGVEALVSRLLSETAYHSYVGILPGGAVRQANLEKLIERAHFYESSAKQGLYGFIRMLDGMKNRGGEGAAQQPAVDAVRVMSIHKSKGLEFPFVFLAGITGKFSAKMSGAAALFDGELGLALKLNGFGESGKRPLFRRAIAMREEYKQREEEKRILYVGMTRARERLCLLGADKHMEKKLTEFARPLTDTRILSAKCYLDWLLGAYYPLGLNKRNAEAGVYAAIGEDRLETACINAHALKSGGIRRTAIKPLEYLEWTEAAKKQTHEELSERLNYIYPHLGETKLGAKRSVTDYASPAFSYSPAVPRFMRIGHSRTAAERGTAMHKVVMHLPLAAHNESSLRAFVLELQAAGKLDADEAECIDYRELGNLVFSSLWGRVISAQRVERELEFTRLQPDGSLVQGIIDCCFIENGHWIIVDYKTTALRGESPEYVAERYRPQLEGYAEALCSLTGLEVAEKWVLLLSEGIGCKLL